VYLWGEKQGFFPSGITSKIEVPKYFKKPFSFNISPNSKFRNETSGR